MPKTKLVEFDKFIKPKEQTRVESISMPAEYWAWVDERAKRSGSNRSQVIRALVEYVRVTEQAESQLIAA